MAIKQYKQKLVPTGVIGEFYMVYVEEELTAQQEAEIAALKLANSENIENP